MLDSSWFTLDSRCYISRNENIYRRSRSSKFNITHPFDLLRISTHCVCHYLSVCLRNLHCSCACVQLRVCLASLPVLDTDVAPAVTAKINALGDATLLATDGLNLCFDVITDQDSSSSILESSVAMRVPNEGWHVVRAFLFQSAEHIQQTSENGAPAAVQAVHVFAAFPSMVDKHVERSSSSYLEVEEDWRCVPVPPVGHYWRSSIICKTDHSTSGTCPTSSNIKNQVDTEDRRSASPCVWLHQDMLRTVDGNDKVSSGHRPRYWGLDWPIEDGVGWGTLGKNVMREALAALGVTALPLRVVDGIHLDPSDRFAYRSTLRQAAFLGVNFGNNSNEQHTVNVAPSLPPGAVATSIGSDSSKSNSGVSNAGLVASRNHTRPLLSPLCAVPLPFPVIHALGRWGPNDTFTSMTFLSARSGSTSTGSSTNDEGGEAAGADLSKPCAKLSTGRKGRGLFWGTVNVGILFSENTAITADDIRFLQHFDAVLAGSSWNANVLRKAGLPASHVAVFKQGVDAAAFASVDKNKSIHEAGAAAEKQHRDAAPRTPAGWRWRAEQRRDFRERSEDANTTPVDASNPDGDTVEISDRNDGTTPVPRWLSASGHDDDGLFFVFSGGKLEYRKGQDVVVAAFKRFAKIHPEARLLVAWANAWPASLATVDDPSGQHPVHTVGLPLPAAPSTNTPQGTLQLMPWLEKQGIAPEQVVDLGYVRHKDMAAWALRAADVALFPNRCEGGTNLVAMEAAAAGAPLVLSGAHGHADLARSLRCTPLRRYQQGDSNSGAFGSEFQGDLGPGFEGCVVLVRQADAPFPPGSNHSGTPQVHAGNRNGWFEANIDEVVAALEALHAHKRTTTTSSGADTVATAGTSAFALDKDERGAAATDAAAKWQVERMATDWSWREAVEGLGRLLTSLEASL